LRLLKYCRECGKEIIGLEFILILFYDYRMLCPALPAGRCKKCVNVSKIFVFFCPAGDIISVEKHHPFIPCPAGDKMFFSSHYVPDRTLVSGGILLSTNMLSPAGQKNE